MPHRRLILTLAAGLSTVALAACGADHRTDAQQITDLTHHLLQDLKDEHFGAFCGRLSQRAQQQIALGGAMLGAHGCDDVLNKIVAAAGPGTIHDAMTGIDPAQIQVTQLAVTGDSAEAVLVMAGQTGAPTHFLRENGKWRVDVDSGAGGTDGAPSIPGTNWTSKITVR